MYVSMYVLAQLWHKVSLLANKSKSGPYLPMVRLDIFPAALPTTQNWILLPVLSKPTISSEILLRALQKNCNYEFLNFILRWKYLGERIKNEIFI